MAEKGHDEMPDVLIVGAGASGAVAAKRLAEEGFDVVVLEQGDWPDYKKARAPYPDYELTSGRDWGWDPNARQGPADYPVDDSESDITALMWNGVGGGTVVFAAHWQRNMPSDFRVRSLDGIADDWPFSYEDLEPYYVRAERDWGVSGLAGDTAFPSGDGPPMPPVPLGAMGRRVAKAHNDLGWHWWPGPNAIATRKYGRLNPCTQRATCLWGCSEGAKASVDRTYWPVAVERGVTLVTGARVKQLQVGPNGLVTGALYVDRQRPPQRVGKLVGSGRQAPDDASLRDGGRSFRRRARVVAGSMGPAHPLARVLRNGPVARLRARSQMGPRADR